MNADLLNFDPASCPRPSGRQVLWVFILFLYFWPTLKSSFRALFLHVLVRGTWMCIKERTINRKIKRLLLDNN